MLAATTRGTDHEADAQRLARRRTGHDRVRERRDGWRCGRRRAMRWPDDRGGDRGRRRGDREGRGSLSEHQVAVRYRRGEGARERVDGRPAIVAATGQGATDDGGDGRVEVRSIAARVGWRLAGLEPVDLDERVVGPRQGLAGQRLPDRGAERVDIGATIDRGGVLKLLGRHERRGAEGNAGAGAGAVDQLGDAEVQHLDKEIRRQARGPEASTEVDRRLHEEEVLGLDVAVDDPGGVGDRQRARDLRDDQGDVGGIGGPGGREPIVHRQAVQILEDKVRRAIGRVGTVDDLDDVRVAKARGGLRLGEEATNQLRAVGQVRPDLLDDDVAL
jgi:hypothetical protein